MLDQVVRNVLMMYPGKNVKAKDRTSKRCQERRDTGSKNMLRRMREKKMSDKNVDGQE